MKTPLTRYLEDMSRLAELLARAGALLAAEAAAHAHIAAATGSVPGDDPRNIALAPRTIAVLGEPPDDVVGRRSGRTPGPSPSWWPGSARCSRRAPRSPTAPRFRPSRARPPHSCSAREGWRSGSPG